MCARRVVPVTTAATVCVTITSYMDKSKVWLVPLWWGPGWHWPVSPRSSSLEQTPKVCWGSQASALLVPPWFPLARRSFPQSLSPPGVTARGCPGSVLCSDQLVSLQGSDSTHRSFCFGRLLLEFIFMNEESWRLLLWGAFSSETKEERGLYSHYYGSNEPIKLLIIFSDSG